MRTRLLATLLSLGAAACHPGPDPGPALCDPAVGDAGLVVGATLEIAEDARSPFAPVGDTMAVSLGGQGGYMVTPVLRLSGAGVPAGRACLRVDLRPSVDGVAADPLVRNAVFDAREGGLVAGPFLLLLAYDVAEVEGRTLGLEATARGEGIDAGTRLEARLVSGR